ncbi:MAG: YbaB/EbfC family nucleoid-associated protein [Oscillospiraceae bacterium]|jgi:DNA-binding YbaB/EbfC family protein|nr:YbaB/EbfC family nucleoid-associated protein [Oscillospiraceae bacterium]
MAKHGLPQGFGGGNMLKQVQRMQEEMLKAQEELEARQYTASAGGGAVTATVSGAHEVVSLTLTPEVVDPEDIDMLTDLIVTAVNSAFHEADETAAKEMSRYTGGMKLPF